MADTAPTITALKPLIQRTPLTDKLLAKPPFRYLHDLVSELIAASGVGAGLFIGDETNAAAVKEKDQKIAWLTKIIKLTELASGTPIKAKPAKIIAGLEPEETNAWLQVLGAVCAKRIDTTQMVASLGGSLPSAAAPPADSLAPPGSELVGAPTAPPTPSQPADTETAPAPSAKPAAAAEPKPASKEVRPGSSAKSPTSKSTSSSSKDKDKDKDKKSSSSSSRSAPSAGASRSSSTSKKPATETANATKSSTTTTTTTTSSRKASTSTSSSKDKEKSSSRDKLSSKSSSSSKSKSQSNSTDQLAAPAPPKPADPPAAVLAAPSSAPEPIPSPAPPIATPADTNPVVLMAATAPGDASSGNIDDDTAAADASDANANAAGGSLGDLVARPIPGTARRERPTTARKAPPRPKQSAPEMGLGLGTEGGLGAMAAGPGGASGLAGARPGTASVVNVVAESSSVSASSAAGLSVGGGSAPAAVDDADDMFVVQRDDTDLPVFGGGSAAVTGAQPLVATANAEPVNPNAPHGGLVRKLLESKRAAADDALVPGLPRPASGMRRATSGGDDSGASAGGKDLAEDLQARVQAVTRAAHPLGRTLDYLHEDMEAMSKELAQWRSESAKYRALLTKEREVTESKVRPLLDEMAKLDAAIVLEQERIAQAKARVLANEELVEKYVLGMVTPGV